MIVNPETILRKRIITADPPIDEEKQLQPNGIDLRIKSVETTVNPSRAAFTLSEDEKTFPNIKQIIPSTYQNNSGWFYFNRGQAYSVECYEYCDIPEDLVGYIVGRSTLNRNGIFIRSSVFDSGYKGYCGVTIYPFINFRVKRETRIAQIIFAEANSIGLYGGQYNQDK